MGLLRSLADWALAPVLTMKTGANAQSANQKWRCPTNRCEQVDMLGDTTSWWPYTTDPNRVVSGSELRHEYSANIQFAINDPIMNETPIFVIYWKDGDESVTYVFDLEENLVAGPGQFTDLRDTFAQKGHVIEECLPEEKLDGLLSALNKSDDET